MFILKNWLKESYIKGVKTGEFSEEYIAIKCSEQVDRARFTDADVEEVYNAIEEWKNSLSATEEPVVEEETVEETESAETETTGETTTE